MWNEIIDEKDIQNFMNMVGFFHDGCVKEMRYTSGAYVGSDLAMYPINDKRILDVIIQQQYNDPSMIEMRFVGLKFLKLVPYDEKYTCEILDSKMFIKNDSIYWCDCGDVSEENFDDFECTIVCATKLLWRSIEGKMGNEEYYVVSK